VGFLVGVGGLVGGVCPLIGLCYECQLFDDLIVNPHDVFMDKVVTERAVYQGRGRRPAS
jgi:5-formyltetrahydrofolate cyclo-ligase